MEQLKIKVFAKINLRLDIKGVLEDGYHSLDMLATSVDIFDEIIIKKAKENVVYMDGVLQDDKNTALKALELLYQAYGYAAEVHIKKGIPMSAGLGGSSADASGVFFAYGVMYGIDHIYMNKLAQTVGSDIVYMMKGGPCVIKCRGEMVFPINEEINLTCVIAQKYIGASTADVYKKYDQLDGEAEHINVAGIDIFNVLEKPAITLSTEIEEAKKDLLKYTNNVFMTGSGSAFVAIFEDENKAQECCDNLKGYIFKKVCRTLPRGIEVIVEE